MQKQKRELFNVYVTDVLRTISENTAHFDRNNGVYVKQRYIDVKNNLFAKKQKADNRTPEEIIATISEKLRKAKSDPKGGD